MSFLIAGDMATATDIITYIGVPLAVLGVTPIFYTFLSALYIRLKLDRILRKNGIWCPIRVRLMTGVVEVDLPVYLLATPIRDRPAHVSPIIGIAGASWTCHSFHRSISERDTVRLQRSDKVVLPAAEISFDSLLEYLLDQGYVPNQEGFRTLRTRRQQTSEGTILMNTNYGRSLCFAKTGNRHGSIVLQFSDSSRSQSNLIHSHRSSADTLPPFHLTGPLLEEQLEASSTNDGAITMNERQDTSANTIEPHSATEKRRHFVMKWAGPVGLETSIHERPPPSPGMELPRDHVLSQLHPDNDILRNGTPWGEPLNWFACAAIAVYGFDVQMPKPFYPFSPHEQFLHTAQWYDVEFPVIMLRGLVRPETQDLDRLLTFSDFDQHDTVGANRFGNPQPADRSTKKWITRRDLEPIAELATKSDQTYSSRLFRLSIVKSSLIKLTEKHVDMPNLLRMCIQSLLSHPIRFGSISIGSLPQEPSGLDHIIQHNADQILRMAILENEFAKSIRAQIHNLLKNPLAGSLEAASVKKATRNSKHPGVEISSGKGGELSKIWTSGLRCSQEETGLFCCGVVLLAAVGQRADYLRSGADIRQCLNDWPVVNIS